MTDENDTGNLKKINLFHKFKAVSSKKKILIISGIILIICIVGIFAYRTNKKNKYNQYNKYINLASTAFKNDNFDEAINDYKLAEKYNPKYESIPDINNVYVFKDSKLNYDKAIELFNKKIYATAINQFKDVIAKDEKRYSDAQKKIQICIQEEVKSNLDLAKKSISQKDYQKAMGYLSYILQIQPDNKEAKQSYSVCEKEAAKIQALAAEAEVEKEAKAQAAEQAKYAPKKIVDKNGKQIWKIYINSGSIHFTGIYTGNGNFIVQLLDSNQDLVELIANEIGDYVSDKTVLVPYEGWYYLQIEGSDGKWNYKWN